MKKRYFFPFMTVLGLGMAVSSCSDDNKDEKKDNNNGTKVEAPTATKFFNEFVADGGTLKVKGTNFSNDTKVTFEGADGAAIEATEVVCKSANELWVTVPAGVKESSYVTFANGDKKGVSTVMLRDTKNVLLDFDSELSIASTFAAGAQGKDDEGNYVMTAPDASIPENYHAAGAKNQYAWFSNDEWQAISFAPGLLDEPVTNNVFGEYLANAKENIENMCIKFEMCVPANGAINGLGLCVGFTAEDETEYGNVRGFCSFFQPAEVSVWDTTDTEMGWKPGTIASYTQTEWMTVTIPMSEILYNAQKMGCYSYASSFVNDWEISEDALADIYSDAKLRNYGAANTAALNNDVLLSTKFGGLMFVADNWSFGQQGGEAAAYKGILAIDNVRVVPNDGNGAVYPKNKYGVPSQHFNF